jgi:uncharacterized protein YhbP (UPF0306 family)
MSKTFAERARGIILTNRYLTMATTDGHNAWAAPLAYVTENTFGLLYYSALEARHTRSISSNATVACAIYDSTASSDDVDGVQLLGQVRELDKDELEHAVPYYFERSFLDPAVRQRWQRPIEDFFQPAPQRFYRITLTQLFVIDFDSPKIDRRVEVPLSELVTHVPR